MGKRRLEERFAAARLKVAETLFRTGVGAGEGRHIDVEVAGFREETDAAVGEGRVHPAGVEGARRAGRFVVGHAVRRNVHNAVVREDTVAFRPVADQNERVRAFALLRRVREGNAGKFERKEGVRRAVGDRLHPEAAVLPKEAEVRSAGVVRGFGRGVRVGRGAFREFGAAVDAVVFLRTFQTGLRARRAREVRRTVRTGFFIRFVAAGSAVFVAVVAEFDVAGVGAFGEVDLFVERVLFHKRQDERGPTHHPVVDAPRFATFAGAAEVGSVLAVEEGVPRREAVVRVVIAVHRQADLLHVVRALHPTRGFAGRLNRREKQTDQNTDDGDNDEKFDEGKTVSARVNAHKLPL